MGKTFKDMLDDFVEIQCTDGIWNKSEYMCGLANGLIIAQALVNGTEPNLKRLKDK